MLFLDKHMCAFVHHIPSLLCLDEHTFLGRELLHVEQQHKERKDPSSRAVLLVPLQHMCVVDANDGIAAVYSRNAPVLL
jgi:hypothetical protein